VAIFSRKTEEEKKAGLYTATQWRLMWIKFRKHKVAMFAGVVVILLYVVVVLAEFVAPYEPRTRSIRHPFVPPMRIRVRDQDGRFHRPFVYGVKQIRDPETFERTYETDPSKRYPIKLFVRGDKYKMWGVWEMNRHLFGLEDKEAKMFLFGTDQQGRDLLSRIIHGARLSLSIGLIGVTLSFILGVILGSISGYFGGIPDMIIQRTIEIIMSIPSLPLWMALSAAIPSSWSVVRVFFAITVIISLIGWTSLARQVRGKFLSLREEEYVVSAVLDGAGTSRVMFRHMIPSFLSHIIATATLSIPGMILGETALSFLGIGLSAPAISWGVLLQSAQNIQTVVLTPWLMLPGLFVVIAVLAFNFLGDGLRDAADPYST